jgi:hypothetical protein
MERIRVVLDAAEYRGLAQLAEQELRAVPDQARHLLRQALQRSGLLPPGNEPVTRGEGDAA